MEIFDVDEIPTHGGSLRIYVKHIKTIHLKNKNIEKILEKEIQFGLNNIKTYQNFSERIDKIKYDLLTFLQNCKENSKTVIGYGAPAKVILY